MFATSFAKSKKLHTKLQRKTSIALAAAPSSASAAVALPGGQRFTVPFSSLFLSPHNVRGAKEPSLEGIRQLAALIEAEGLLADLHVSVEVAGGKPTGRHGVEAGGRRWRALGLLVSDGKLHPEAPINCIAVAPESATAVSLSENLGQEVMHPASEFAAYARLVAEGKTVEAVAARFGVTVLHVQRRMRLAAVAPTLLQLYRDDKATLDQMMALASVDDHKRQLAVWKATSDYNRSASAIRRKLTEAEVPAADARVKLIGLARYQACGGTLRTDLFSDETYLDDPGLVDLLVAEVLTERADKVRAEGWGWVAEFAEFGHEQRQSFRQPSKRYRAESDDERSTREALEAELESLEDRYNALADSDESEERDAERLTTIDAECDAIRARIDAAREARLDASGMDKAKLGAVVIADHGSVTVMRGMMTAAEAKTAEKAAQTTGGSQGTGASARGDGGAASDKGGAVFSERLMLDLTSHRTAALQAVLLGNVPVALAVLTAELAVGVFGRCGRGRTIAQISLKQCSGALGRDATGYTDSPARALIGAQRERWVQTLPEDSTAWLAWLLAQPAEVVTALLAFCVSQSLDATQRRAEPNASADTIARALSLDMADWWSPSPQRYLAQVPKATLVADVIDAAGDAAAKDLAKMKKPQAIAAAAQAMLDKRWLPAPLRTPGLAA